MIYLASPYTHDDPAIREARFEAACHAAGQLMMVTGDNVFSAIAHTHPIATRCDLSLGWAYWKSFDLKMLEACDELVVLMLDGWRESKGVTAEIAFANEMGIPVNYMTDEPHGFERVEDAA